MSGAFASVTNIPFDVAKSRIQGPQPVDNPLKYSTTTATLRIIVKEEGYVEELEMHVKGILWYLPLHVQCISLQVNVYAYMV